MTESLEPLSGVRVSQSPPDKVLADAVQFTSPVPSFKTRNVWAAIAPYDIKVIMKKEVLKIPVFGLVFRMSGHIAIDRQNQEKAFKSIEKAAERIKKGVCVFMAPEGTRSPDGKIQQFKKGGFVLALKAGVPIVPMCIRGANEIMPKHSFVISSGTIRVTIGKPIETTNYTLEDRDKLIKVVRDEVIKNFEDDDWWRE